MELINPKYLQKFIDSTDMTYYSIARDTKLSMYEVKRMATLPMTQRLDKLIKVTSHLKANGYNYFITI